jgi:hypothetical protein
LLEEFVDKRRLAMVDVGDDRNIAQGHGSGLILENTKTPDVHPAPAGNRRNLPGLYRFFCGCESSLCATAPGTGTSVAAFLSSRIISLRHDVRRRRYMPMGNLPPHR